MSARAGVLLIAHGTVETLDELEPFLASIRRGHAPSPELIAEVRRRYEAIGGRSPLLDTTRLVAKKLEAKLGMPAKMAMRLWKPFPREVLRECVSEGITSLVVVTLAQYSSHVYEAAVREAAAGLGAEAASLTLLDAGPWSAQPDLVELFASRVKTALASVPAGTGERTRVLFSAHSLPTSIVRSGDPYEKDVRAAVLAVRERLPPSLDAQVIFQSQGMSLGPGGKPMEWLGPDVRAALDAAKSDGVRHVIFAPIGFLADHVEILYDLDIEARAWAEALGLGYHRTESLNADDAFVEIVAALVTKTLARGSP